MLVRGGDDGDAREGKGAQKVDERLGVRLVDGAGQTGDLALAS